MSPTLVTTVGPRNAYTDPETGIRFYVWNGIEYPSVTSVRNLAGMPLMLANWRTTKVIERAITSYDKLGQMLHDNTDPKAIASWLRMAATEERDKAAGIGTKVHDAAAAGTPLDKVSSDVAPSLLQYRRWVSDTGFEILLTEQQVFNLTYGYAGTFDVLGRFPKTGDIWMIDLKTGKGVYSEHALQLEAYRRAEIVGENDVVDAFATNLLQNVVGSAILHLRPEGWTFKVVPSSDETWVAFRALLAFAKWVHAHPTVDGLISISQGSQP